jgi:multidrug efflux system outer membrane protein
MSRPVQILQTGARERRRGLAPLAAFATMLLGGCVVGPNFHAPTPKTPPAWRAATLAPEANVTQAALDPAWWKSFGDPELSSLVDRALAANLGARTAVLRIEEAREERGVAAAAALPSIGATAAYSDTRISERTAAASLVGALGAAAGAGAAGQTGQMGGLPAPVPGFTNPFNQYQAGLVGSWELDLFGRVRREVEAADAQTAAAIEDHRAVQVALMGEVAAAYIDLRSAQARRLVAQQSVDTAEGLLKLASDAREADLGSDLDVATAKAALSSARAALPPLATEISLDENELALLMDAEPGDLDAELAAAKPIPPTPPEVPVGLPSELARRRPDIRKAEAQLHAAVANQGVAIANLYPRVTINAAAGTEASAAAALGDWAARYFSIGPTLDLPIFDAGVRRADVRIAGLRAKEAALAYAQTVLQALHEVEDDMGAYGQEKSRRGDLEAAVDESRTALALAERRYKAGKVSFRDVLIAQQHLESAELALIGSTAAVSTDLVSLYRALGGGWEAAPNG